jgi:hypothetical protein
VTVISSASGTRIDCDGCGDHVMTTHNSTAALRLATGYALVDGHDFCPRCVEASNGAQPDAPLTEPPDSGPAAA